MIHSQGAHQVPRKMKKKKKDHTTLYHHEISSLYREREHSDSKAFGKKGGGVDTKD